MKKLFMFLLLLPSLWVDAQSTINFISQSGIESEHFLSNIKKQTFANGKLISEFNDATQTAQFTLSDLRKIVFNYMAPTSMLPDEIADKEVAIRVYPNPTSSVLYIDYYAKNTRSFQVDIINMQGQFIISHKQEKVVGNNQLSLSVQELPNGIYFCRIYDDYNHVITKKIIKY